MTDEKKHKKKGGFKKGVSGNPAGRKKGIKDRRVQYSDLMKAHAPELIEKCVEMAKAGDVGAIKLCFSKIIPNATGTYLSSEQVKRLNEGGIEAVLEVNKGIINAAIDKEVTVEHAQSMSNIMKSHADLLEKSDIFRKMEERLLNLENKLS